MKGNFGAPSENTAMVSATQLIQKRETLVRALQIRGSSSYGHIASFQGAMLFSCVGARLPIRCMGINV